MSPTLSIVFIFAVFATFILRLLFQTSSGSDAPVHVWRILSQRPHSWISHEISDAVVGKNQAYPKFIHFLISRFPEKYWGVTGNLLNSGLDYLIAVIAFWSSSILVQQALSDGVLLTPELADCLPFISVVLFLTAPVLLPIDARMKGINGRVPGMFFISIYLVCLYNLMHHSALAWSIPCMAAAYFAIATSQFALQVFLLFSAFQCIWLWSAWPLVAASAAILINLFLGRYSILPNIKFWWIHKLWYYKSRHNVEFISSRNRFKDLLSLPKLLFTDFKRFMFIVFFTQSLTLLLINGLPVLFLLFIFTGAEPSPLFKTPFYDFWFGVVLAGISAFVLTLKGPLKVIGEAERYLEYSFLGVAMLLPVTSGILLTDAIPILAILILYQVTIVLLNLLISTDPRKLFGGKLGLPPYTEAAANFLMKEGNCGKICVIPVKSAMALGYILRNNKTDFKLYYRHMNDNSWHFSYMIKDLGGELTATDGLRWKKGKRVPSSEIFNRTASDLVAEYGFNYFIIEKKYLDRLSEGWIRDLGTCTKMVFDHDECAVYKVLGNS